MSMIMARAKPPIVPRPTGVRINPFPMNSGHFPMNSGRPMIGNSNEARFQAESRFYHLDRARAMEDTQMTDASLIHHPVLISPSIGSQVMPTMAGVHFPAGVAAGSNLAAVKPGKGLMWRHGFIDPHIEMKRAKRIMSNRLSAQRSRFKKVEYVSNTEKKAENLEAEIKSLTQNVESERNEKKKLELEKILLRRKLDFLDQRTNHFNVEMEKNKEEVRRLRELHMEQQCMSAAAAAQAEVLQQHVAPAKARALAPPLEEDSGTMEQIWDYKFFMNPDVDLDQYLDPIFNVI